MMNKTKILIFFVITILFSYSATKKEISPAPERALSVKYDVIKINSKTLKFVIETTRLKNDTTEYFPNAEHVRLLISDKNDKNVWRSDNKFARNSEISKPLPDSIGKTYKYTIDWYGTDNASNILKTGKYKVQLSLTLRPKAYVIDTVLDWTNPYDR